MLQRLTDRVNYLNIMADNIHRKKEELQKLLDKITDEWQECEDKITKLLPEGVSLSDHFGAEEERRKSQRPDQLPPEPSPKPQTPDEGHQGTPPDSGSQESS